MRVRHPLWGTAAVAFVLVHAGTRALVASGAVTVAETSLVAVLGGALWLVVAVYRWCAPNRHDA